MCQSEVQQPRAFAKRLHDVLLDTLCVFGDNAYTIFLEGPAAVGKTTLCRTFADQSHPVLFGDYAESVARCPVYEHKGDDTLLDMVYITQHELSVLEAERENTRLLVDRHPMSALLYRTLFDANGGRADPQTFRADFDEAKLERAVSLLLSEIKRTRPSTDCRRRQTYFFLPDDEKDIHTIADTLTKRGGTLDVARGVDPDNYTRNQMYAFQRLVQICRKCNHEIIVLRTPLY